MDNKKTNTDFLDNGYSIPYPEDPFEMNSGPFYVGEGNNGETIVSLEVTAPNVIADLSLMEVY